ncbi:MAG TPA: hypothetical protein VHN20_19195 [Beijerinckiaceae bacterium]|nr:hypothetical protein [Beijerinckiaceae bacterium]
MLIGILCDAFHSPLRTAVREQPDLVAYRDRIVERFLPTAQIGRVAA